MRTVRCSGRLMRGVYPGGGCLLSAVSDTSPPPLWTEFLTHACENITFPADGKNSNPNSIHISENLELDECLSL